jgi:hypothetical protein
MQHEITTTTPVIVRHRSRKGLAIALGLAAMGFTAASAASLGGIDSKQLGASSEVVASCDTDSIISSFSPAYNPEILGYGANVVILNKIDEKCMKQTMSITLADAKGNALATQVVTVDAPDMKIDGFIGVPADQVERIAVTIYQPS